MVTSSSKVSAGLLGQKEREIGDQEAFYTFNKTLLCK